MVCLGLEPMTAGWLMQTNEQTYGGLPFLKTFYCEELTRKKCRPK